MIIPNYFTIHSNLRSGQVILRLGQEIRTYTGLSNSDVDPEQKRFKLVRRPGSLGYVGGRSRLKIVLRGSVTNENNSTKICTWVLPSTLVAFAMCFVVVCLVIAFKTANSNPEKYSPSGVLFASLTLLCVAVLVTKIERNKSRKFLEGLLREK